MTQEEIKRKPIGICPAGKYYRDPETVKDLLKVYQFEDTVDALKHEKNIFYEKEKNFKKYAKIFRPITREVPEIIQLGRKNPTRYQSLIEDLKNTPYSSYWEREPGRRKDVNPLPYPVDTPLHTITFGIKTINSYTVKDCLEYWFLDEPSPYEKFMMKRKQPIRPAKKEFEAVSRYDPRGMWMKCIMRPGNEKFIVADSVQADFQENYSHILEKPRIDPRSLTDFELKRACE